MKLARVVGNVVSTIKDPGYYSYKLMIVEFLDEKGYPIGARQIAFDGAQAGIGDIVLVSIDGGAANLILDETIIADFTICGVIDHYTYEDETTEFRGVL
ncbi:hypothetical protein AGMMS49983_06020 [Clostridia bacterium]|nr:hypothetical protein AGMMS49983_06020 [Clostridia bacterium]